MVAEAHDSVQVPIAALADSLRAILDSLPVRLTDTVRVVSPGEIWSLANVIAAAGVVVLLVFSWLVYRIQEEQKKLQEAQNGMVERHERERRELEDAIRTQRTEAIDKRIGWFAFRLSGRLRGWMAEKVIGLTVDELAETTRGGRSDLWGAWVTWAERRSSPQELGPVEKSVEAIMYRAATASPETARTAEEACRLLYQALSSLRNGVRHVRDHDITEQVAINRGERPLSPEGGELFLNGYDGLKACVETLERLVPPGLREHMAFLLRAGAGAYAITGAPAELSVRSRPQERDGTPRARSNHEDEAKGDG